MNRLRPLDSPVRGVAYDMDGTLTRPYIDWQALRTEMGLPEGSYILEYLESLKEAARELAEAVLLRYEKEAAENSELNAGARETIEQMHAAGIPQAIVTNNSRISADTVVAKHDLRLDHVITREDGAAKPAGDLLLLAAQRMQIGKDEMLFVGDGRFDLSAAEDAGVRFVLLTSRYTDLSCRYNIDSLWDLPRLGFEC